MQRFVAAVGMLNCSSNISSFDSELILVIIRYVFPEHYPNVLVWLKKGTVISEDERRQIVQGV